MSSCTNPILAVRLYKPDGLKKQSIKILPRRPDMGIKEYGERYGKDNILLLPCGHCPSCLSRRSKEWSVRCALEALDHKQNCFLTLTYDVPAQNEEQVKDDLKIFLKRLRNKGIQVRYFGCCERGDQYGRLHAHMLLFGYFPPDVHPWAKSKSGVMQFTSEIISEAWRNGLCVVAEFSPYAAQYVAGYVVKKFATGDSSFHIQSTRPGIGAGYLLKNIQDIYADDKLILSFGNHKFSVPRYFDKLAENLCMDLSDVKANRLEKASLLTAEALRDHAFDNPDKLLDYNEQLSISKIRYAKRSF